MSVFRHLLLFCLVAASLPAAVPSLLHHQGRMAVNGVNFDGTGLFKFALVSADGSTTYWSNNGSSTAGSQPTAAVSIPVILGHYSLNLGDTALTNMSALPPEALDHPDVQLRIWFSNGPFGFQHITPDQRLVSVPYALVASKVERILLSDLLDAPADPVLAWGEATGTRTTVPADLAHVTAISSGDTQSLALKEDGTVIAWGSGPALPAGLTQITHIASGHRHHLAIKQDGSVLAWGDNTYGQCNVPAGITTATRIAAGERHSLVLLANGTVLAWGDNTFGQTTLPGSLTGITAIACGADHSLALKSDGTVITWGRNDALQLDIPAGIGPVKAIGAGDHHSLAVKIDGTVAAWGWDDAGHATVPANLVNVTAVTGGYAFSMALKADGTVVTWGDSSAQQHLVPAQAKNVIAIAAGDEFALALRAPLVPAALARTDADTLFSGKIGVKRTPATNSLEVEGTASKSTAGAWLANSDRRIKSSIEPLEGALEKLAQVRLVNFRYTPDYLAAHPGIPDRRYLNVIAQEFAQVFPEHVQNSGETLPDGSPILQVDTYPLTIYSAAAVQELAKENAALKKQLQEQEERLKRLEARIQP